MNRNIAMAFASIDKRIDELIPVLEEIKQAGSEMVFYGKDNRYPEYLYGLYNDCTSLKTVIDGTAEYVAGDDVISNITHLPITTNGKDTWREFVTLLATDYLRYGGFCFEVIRTRDLNGIAEVHYIDFREVRSDEDNEVFYYNPDFKKRYVRNSKTVILPKFKAEIKEPASIVYYKNIKSSVYPIPRYSGALKCCEIERGIDEMHLAGVSNGFYGSYLVNINTGVPSEDEQDQLEKDFNEKFCGAGNAGRFVLNFSNGKDNAATLEKLDVVDFGEKYKAAATRSREQIYASFRAIPALFGVMTETTGFNEQEFAEAFRLYNRTMVRPIQRTICDVIDYVFEQKDCLSIKPFSIDDNVNNEQIVN